MSAEVAGEFGPHHARLPAHRGEEARRFREAVWKQHLRAALLQPRDPSLHLLGGARPEARELRESAVARRLVERLQRLDAEALVDTPDARGSEPGHAQHLEEPFRRGLT